MELVKKLEKDVQNLVKRAYREGFEQACIHVMTGDFAEEQSVFDITLTHDRSKVAHTSWLASKSYHEIK